MAPLEPFAMGLLDWLFGRKPPRKDAEDPAERVGTSEHIHRASSDPNSGSCPQCGTRMRQTRKDGRCVACGTLLPEPLRAPAADAQAGENYESRSGLPRPKDVVRIGPMVIFDNGAMRVMMDQDAFEYTYGDTKGPDPAQRDLNELLPKVTRVCVLEGAMLQGRAMGGPVLLDTRDAGAIQALADCLQIVEDPSTFGRCACLGGPTMELYAGLEHLATIGLQHGRAIRWRQWHHDAQLQAGERLTHWLQDQGIDRSRLEAIYHRGDSFLVGEPVAPSGDPPEALWLCEKAQERAQEGNLADALRLCNRAVKVDPDRVEPYALRGKVHYDSGRMEDAAADCTTAIDRGHREAVTYLIRAIAHDSQGRVEEALADLSMALHLHPEYPQAYNSRGLIRSRLGQYDEARADLSEAIRLAPDWFLPYLYRAQLAHGRGQFDPALADYDRAIELVEAVSSQQPATRDGPMPALVYCHRGDARYDLFREEEAEADFAEAARHHPAAAAGYLGEMWLRRSKYRRALEAYSELVRLRPEEARGYLGRGLTWEALKELEQAEADYSTAIGLEPEGGAGYLLRGRVRHSQGRTDDALGDLSEHLRRHPRDASAYLFRSGLHKERQDLEAAIEDLHAAHRAAPDNPLVCNNLAWVLATCTDARFRDGARAVELARQACRLTDWGHPFCLGTLGAALAETGAFDEAIRWQTEALDLYPESEKAAGRERLELYRAGQPYRQ